jgi:hypothetical protein
VRVGLRALSGTAMAAQPGKRGIYKAGHASARGFLEAVA